MIYKRRYVQFNDLVFDSYDMTDESEISTDMSTKIVQNDYTFTHGAYSPNKHDYMLFEAATVDLTLYLTMTKLPCDKRPFYRQMAIGELVRPGRLWAVVNNELVWAYAKVSNFSEINSVYRDTIELNVSFLLPEGVWHKADGLKTFLRPYDPCDFMDCYGFGRFDPCRSARVREGSCCIECGGQKNTYIDCTCCDCTVLSPDWALCLNKDRLQRVFDSCAHGMDFQIEYNCAKAQEFFGDDYLGQRFCAKDSCSDIIAGSIYADTDIPTASFDIILHGRMKDPEITINDNTNVIEGDYSEYDGVMTIKSNGDVYYRHSDCCDDELIPPVNWKVPAGNEYGWTLRPAANKFIVYTNACCGMICAYVQVDGLTI